MHREVGPRRVDSLKDDERDSGSSKGAGGLKQVEVLDLGHAVNPR